MPDVDLARREGVELVRTGSWSAASGSWTPTREDILSAVKATECPAVRRPRLKLGHFDTRFNDGNGDGEPALGWFENLRAADGGHTLVGDQVALPWLNQIQAAAYPDRSIEGTYKMRCGLDHVHPFVITAVALLGVAPPAVSALKSIADLPEMLGVAAAEDDPDNGEHVEVVIRAEAGTTLPTTSRAQQIRAAWNASDPPLTQWVQEARPDAAVVVDDADRSYRLYPVTWVNDEPVFGQPQAYDPETDRPLVFASRAESRPDVEARSAFDEHKHKRDGDGQFAHTAGGPGDSPSGATRAVRLKDSEGKHVDLAFTGGAMSMRIPYDDPGDDPERDTPPVFDTVHLDQATTAEFAEELDATVDLRDAYVTKAKKAFNRLIALEDDGKTGTPEHQQAQDAWFKIGGDGQRIAGGELPAEQGDLVYETRMGDEATDTQFLIAMRPPDAGEDWNLQEAASDFAGGYLSWSAFKRLKKEVDAAHTVAASASTPVLPAAEPEPENPDPKEDLVSTDLSAVRSRLGLTDDADEQAILSALDALKAKAELPPAILEPNPELVAASAAAAEKATKAEQAQELMKEELTKVRDELNTIKASAASTVKASFFKALGANGQLKPAERETWEARYDRDPEMVTEILGGRPVGSEVPVMASGVTGPAEPETSDLAGFEADYERAFGEKAGA